MNWLCYGKILAFLAAATIALTVADLILTDQFYCINGGQGPYCSYTNNNEPYWPVWVSSGIWAGFPVFITGLVAICGATSAERQGCFRFLLLLSALVFTPAIVILTSIELWAGGSWKYTLYSLSNGVQSGTITPPTNPYQAKFALPLVVAILGGIMWLMTMWLFLTICCCRAAASKTVVVEQPAQPPVIVYERPRPQIVAPPRCDPCSQFPSLPYLPTRYSGGNAYNFFPASKPNSFYYG